MNAAKKAEQQRYRAWLRGHIARCRAEIVRYEKAVARRPNTYLPRLAEAQHELGKFYWWRHTQASYRMALRLFTQALRNCDRYRGRRNLTLQRLTLLSDLQQLSLRLDNACAEEVLFAVLSAYENLAAAAPFIYGEDVASTLWQLGNLYADERRFDEAERMYLRALDKHAEFDEEDPHRYRPATAQCRRSLGRLYEEMHDDVRAEAAYLASESMLRELCENPFERCNHLRPLARTLMLLADLYERRGTAAEAARCRAEAETLEAECAS